MKRGKDRKDGEPPPSAGSELANQAAERLASIVGAAEQAAEQVIDDAEARAREVLAAAEAEAERIRGEALAALERARRELGALAPVPTAPEPPAPSRSAHLSAVPATEPAAPPAPATPRPAPEPQPEAPPSERGTAAGARLLATQMAVSGSSREEIEARLRNGFEIEDTTAILDAILGPED